MPATVVELTKTFGHAKFYCPFCGTAVFTLDDGINDNFCEHVRVFVDWVGELYVTDAELETKLDIDEIQYGEPSELAKAFDADTVVFELFEPGRGGGHQGTVCLIAVTQPADIEDEDEDE